MSDIKALLFGPNLPIAGQSVTCSLSSNTVQIQSGDILKKILFTDLQAKIAGFDHDLLQITWEEDGSAWSLMPINKVEQDKLSELLPKNLIAGMQQWRRATQSQSLIWRSILYAGAFIFVSFLLLIWQHDRVTAWVADLVSIEHEVNLGEAFLEQLKSDGTLLKQGQAVATVEAIGKQLTAGSRYKYQWYVSKSSEINAFALPGGIIVVNSGLLKTAGSADELAAVLAHEVQHVEQKHALKNMINSAGMAAVIFTVLGDANAIVMLMTHQVSTQYFSRQVESEADLKGIQLLIDKNMQAAAMVSFFKKMDEESIQKKVNTESKQSKPDKTGQPEKNDSKSKKKEEVSSRVRIGDWFSSHPDTATRIQEIETYIAKHPCSTCKPLTWDKAKILVDIAQSTKTKAQN
jgi:beta-barrel assembly-enhancing protease